VEIAGEQLHAGDQLMLMYPSANRDDAVFADPFRLDVRRDPNPHLAFGFGPHFCLGASLARLELQVMFEQILVRLPDLELATDEPLPYRASNFIVGPESMPVRFTPTPRRS
jgi:cytochrome P450 family 142 subfamily A polypeptide 1